MKKFWFFFCLFFAACGSPAYNSCLTVQEVIDGDTLRLSDGRTVRYIGIDTPETRTREDDTWRYDPQPFAEEAKEFNRSLVEGKCLRLEKDAEALDKYGRVLGYVFVGDTLVNESLLAEGYAVLYTRPPNVRYSRRLIAAQASAREKKKGLWAAYQAVGSDQAGGYIGQIRTVRGVVRSTYKSQKCIFLNFGTNWKTDFTAVIFNNSLASFQKRGIDPAVFYRGKQVEVTGRIREYNGPEIIVNIPEEIIVLDN